MNLRSVFFFTCAISVVMTANVSPPKVLFFDMDAAVEAEKLTYREQLIAFVFEGLVNHVELPHPRVMFNAGYMNFDWPASDSYWNSWLTEQGRLRFINVSTSTLCGLVSSADPEERIKGTVIYEATTPEQEEWTLPIATTLASQQQLLPVTRAILDRHSCLSSLPVVSDLTQLKQMVMQT